jgi:hypothetical protein
VREKYENDVFGDEVGAHFTGLLGSVDQPLEAGIRAAPLPLVPHAGRECHCQNLGEAPVDSPSHR